MRMADDDLALACKLANEDPEIAELERDWDATIGDFDDSSLVIPRSEATEGSAVDGRDQ